MNRRALDAVISERLEGMLGTAIARVLALDPRVPERLGRLEGRTIALGLRDRDARLFALIEAGDVHIRRTHEGPVDVAMSGRASDYLALARANRRGESIAAGRIEITGDLAIAQEVQALLGELDLDWEAALAGVVGDMPARQLGRVARGARDGAEKSYHRFERELAEFLLHELRAVPARAEVETQRQEIFLMADRLERAVARVARLRTRSR